MLPANDVSISGEQNHLLQDMRAYTRIHVNSMPPGLRFWANLAHDSLLVSWKLCLWHFATLFIPVLTCFDLTPFFGERYQNHVEPLLSKHRLCAICLVPHEYLQMHFVLPDLFDRNTVQPLSKPLGQQEAGFLALPSPLPCQVKYRHAMDQCGRAIFAFASLCNFASTFRRLQDLKFPHLISHDHICTLHNFVDARRTTVIYLP